jgi:ferredoxin
MKIGILGSGASAYGALLSVLNVKKKLEITIISKDANYQNKIFIKKKDKKISHERRHNFGVNLDKISINNSKSFLLNYTKGGGLSDFWSGAIAVPTKSDLKRWNLQNVNFSKYYEILKKNIPISGEKRKHKKFTNLSQYINSPEIKISSVCEKIKNTTIFKKNLQISTNAVAVNTKKNINFCTNCTDCFNGCGEDAIFRPSKYIDNLIKNNKINYINGRITKISKDSKVKVFAGNKIYKYDKIFICLGAINTAKLIINSFGASDRTIEIYDIPVQIFPTLTFPEKKLKKNYYGFSNLRLEFFKNKDHFFSLIGQIPKSFFTKNFRIKFISNFIYRLSQYFISYIFVYGSYKDYISYTLDNNLNFKIKKETLSLNYIIKELKKNLLKKKFFIVNFFNYKIQSSAHYSSNIFNAYKKENASGMFLRNIYICDSSVLNAPSSSSPHTFFLMANAYRICEKALEK